MKYIDVNWHHNHKDEPTRLVSEIDENNFEVRKIEFFRNGRVSFASRESRSGETRLGEAEVPNIAEINADPQFIGISIDASEFNKLWQQHVKK